MFISFNTCYHKHKKPLPNSLPIILAPYWDVINEIPNISVISKIELLGFNTTNSDFVLLTDFVEDSNVFDLSSEVVLETINIRKEFKIKLPDSIIAATALVNNLTLITRNTSDFKKISNLKLINPYDISPFDPFSIPLF